MPNGYQGPETHNERVLERQLSLANDRIRELEAERDRLIHESIPNGNLMHRSELEACFDKALTTLREIDALPEARLDEVPLIVRRAIAEIEGRYDDIPGAGQRGC